MKKIIAGYFRVGTKEQAKGYPIYTDADSSGKDIQRQRLEDAQIDSSASQQLGNPIEESRNRANCD